MSVIATAMRELMAAGIAGEALVAAVERIEAAQAAAREPIRTARQERNARYYENRKARLEASETSETVLTKTLKTVSDAVCRKEGPTTQETTHEGITPSVAKATSSPRGGRPSKPELCPENFQPGPAHFAKAEAAGRDRAFVESVAGRMFRWSRSNATRKIAKKSDWSLTLHDWIDRAIEEAPSPRTRHGPSGGSPSGPRISGLTQYAIDKFSARRTEDHHEPTFELDSEPPAGRFDEPSGHFARGEGAARRDGGSSDRGSAGPVLNFPARRAV